MSLQKAFILALRERQSCIYYLIQWMFFFSSSSVSVEISFCHCETFVAVNTSSIFESDESDLMAPHGSRLAVTLAASVLFILKSQLCTRQKLFQFFFFPTHVLPRWRRFGCCISRM